MKTKATMAVVAVGLLVSGCSMFNGIIGGGVTKRPSYRYFDNPQCAGYGAVNYWQTLSASDQAEAISSRGLDVYHIELLSWAEARTDIGAVKSKYKKLLSECRDRRVVLFISVFNDNSHLAKYGNTPWVPAISYLHSALDIILAEGPTGVIVQPVGETQTSLGSKFEGEARSRLAAAGFMTCYNRGSRPTGAPGGWNFAAYHPFHLGDKIPGGAVCVTDTGSILLSNGAVNNSVAEDQFLILELGGYDKFNPDTVKTYANKVLNTYHRPVILYGFLHKSIDKASLDALASVHQK